MPNLLIYQCFQILLGMHEVAIAFDIHNAINNIITIIQFNKSAQLGWGASLSVDNGGK